MRKTLLAALMCAATSANAGFYSGNKLYSQLEGEANDRIMAMGYIAGVHDALETVVVCSPDSINLGQVRDIVHAYLRVNAAERHLAADVLMTRALRLVWPCKGRGSQL